MVSRLILNPRRTVIAQFPDAFGMSVTVEDMDAARSFYMDLYPHDHVSEGAFAGINYLSIMRDGETLVNIFQKGEGNPLADGQRQSVHDQTTERLVTSGGAHHNERPDHIPGRPTPIGSLFSDNLRKRHIVSEVQ